MPLPDFAAYGEMVYFGPNIKHHRIPAPGIGFDRPNLPQLIEDVQRDILGTPPG